MWKMHVGGVGVLRGPLRKLFIAGVTEAAAGQFLEDPEFAIDNDWIGWGTGLRNGAYERLEPTEKVYALAEVARALTNKSEPPIHNQWNEATVYAVFEEIACEVAVEIEDSLLEGSSVACTYWRSLVADAEKQVRELIDDEDEYIDVASVDVSEWSSVVLECLSGIILWDLDFLDNDIPDLPPHASREAHSFFGIHGEYYTATVPVVTTEEFKKAERFLRKLRKTI
jgi:hypothetical protein